MPVMLWTAHTGHASLPTKHKRPLEYRNKMCPAGIATTHPAGEMVAASEDLKTYLLSIFFLSISILHH